MTIANTIFNASAAGEKRRSTVGKPIMTSTSVSSRPNSIVPLYSRRVDFDVRVSFSPGNGFHFAYKVLDQLCLKTHIDQKAFYLVGKHLFLL